MAAENNLTTAGMLDEVNKAIYAVLVGGQSYKIGSRQLSRADLKLLYDMKNDLTAQIASQGESQDFSHRYSLQERRHWQHSEQPWQLSGQR